MVKIESYKKFWNIVFVIDDLSRAILKKLTDYEAKIKNNPSIKKDLRDIDFIYMHSTLLDLAKLVSQAGNDRSGLNELKKISPKKIKAKIEAFYMNHREIVVKIMSNRNRIVAHVDIDKNPYFNMKFSGAEINKVITDHRESVEGTGMKPDLAFIAALKSLKSTTQNEERYSPSDFEVDIDTFRKMIQEVSSFVTDAKRLFYSQANT